MVREARQREYIASLDKQLKISDEVIVKTRQRYANGDRKVDYLRTLDTLESHQRLQRTALFARRELVDFRIALYRALAGSVEGQASVDSDNKKQEANK